MYRGRVVRGPVVRGRINVVSKRQVLGNNLSEAGAEMIKQMGSNTLSNILGRNTVFGDLINSQLN